MSKNNLLSWLWKKIKRIALWFFVLHLAYIILLRWVNPPLTITQLASWTEGYGLKRDYVDFKAMSPNIRLAVMASEDQLFPDHNGFDLKSIKKALENNKKSKRMRGASTISQQVAKNVFLWQGRSWFRKGLEVYFTFMIELLWSKERILEMYLNVSEMGTGIFGVEAAAQKYFKKPASKLTRTEAARIAAVLPNPKKYKAEPASPYVARRTSWILIQMKNLEGDEEVAKLLEVVHKGEKSNRKK
ncbi:MAG: monofunctional biosynthetic peptidoglycan transglycosylase [Bacteroidetes bacterium OLB12]|nr:MAG: monofunctional biosynthetic peptidoglycan transglycosylase [Bacteroidetes bacterium OLB12]HNR75313.1 monofunctional biosynthetic peptidoglycan transglycosylase [Cyclobacteriaceae bacterium]